MKARSRPGAGVIKIVLAYAVFAALWILLSDRAAGMLFREAETLTLASMLKGWAFVAVTSLLLYGLIRRLTGELFEAYQRELAFERERRHPPPMLVAIAEASSDGIFAKDLDGRYVLFNEAAARIAGKPVESVLGNDASAVFPPELARRLMEQDRRIHASGVSETSEETLRTPDGERTFLTINGPLRGADGSIFGTYGISRDITDRKHDEQALRHMADDMDATIRAIPDLMFEVDASGQYQKVKALNSALLAAPPQELVGRTVTDVLPPDAAATCMQALSAASATGSDFGRTIRLPLPDGERHFELSVARKPVPAGEEARFIVLSRDITARHAAEAELQRSERNFRNFFDAGLVGMAIGTPDRLWGRCNARLADMLGYQAQELAALSWSDMTHPDDLAEDEARLARVLTGKVDGYAMDKRFIRRDGSVLHASIAVRCERGADGTPVSIFKTVADIGARVQAESALRSNERRLQALLDNLSCGVIVHDADTHIVDANPSASQIIGLTLEQLRGKDSIDPCWCFLEEDGSTMPTNRFPVHQVLASDGAITQFVMGVRRPDLERPVWVQVDAYPVRDDHDQLSQVVVTFADITELKQAEDRTRRLNRSLRVLSSCNLGLVEIRDEPSYLALVCEAVVAAGDYRLACVIFANQDPAKSARIVASAGPETAYLDEIQLSWDADVPTGRGPFGTAVRTGRAQVNQDWMANPAMTPWRAAAVRHGFQSSVGLPLTASGKVIGILSLYASEVDAFNAEELPPLEELARIVSAAIDTLRSELVRNFVCEA